ncbi:hypothetical protein [Candidatus Odyssella acanthamoebae]|uniref:Uncharacterized protein n=1 Tax=Candidatus Odyssella acanthamoebae TaxID=91604 RepID=A0A077AWB3_9PROT|nr:hypothetical protein [Candidatus Paracaedibacter acanthamoebae]AIK96711.1 hypothetical protein ID47_08235 [Candidatus Paracaedibacter acanthamoebae]
MNYRDPYESKKFFQSQWHQPFRRFRKTVLPIIVSGISVFIVMMGIFAFFPGFINNSGNSLLIILHTSIAVLGGVAIAFLGHLISLKSLSRFETIKIRNRSKK